VKNGSAGTVAVRALHVLGASDPAVTERVPDKLEVRGRIKVDGAAG